MNYQEPLDIYSSIQPLIERDIERVAQSMLQKDKFSTSDVQVHSHDGIGSVKFPLQNLQDAIEHSNNIRVTLTPAQVKALFTTPITLVPIQAPILTATQAKSFILVTGISAYITYKGTAYTGANALEFRYTNGAGTKVTADIPNTFINSASSALVFAPAVTATLTPISNAPIVVSVPVANPATGNSPITFFVNYKVISFV